MWPTTVLTAAGANSNVSNLLIQRLVGKFLNSSQLHDALLFGRHPLALFAQP